MEVREIVTRFGFSVNQKPLTDMENNVKSITKSIAVVGALASAAVGSLFGIALSTAKIGEEAKLTSQKLGMTTQAIQGLNYAAKQNEIDQEAMTMGMQRFARNIINLRTGSEEAAKGFHLMGLSTQYLMDRHKGTLETLMQTADIFHKMQDGQTKTAIAMELFGRSGARMIPMLNKGSAGIHELMSEAQKLGIVMSDDQIKASMKFDNAWKKTTSIVSGLKIMIGSDFMPVFTRMLEKFSAWYIQNKDIIKQDLSKWLKFAEENVGKFVTALKILLGLGIVYEVGFLTTKIIAMGAAWAAAGTAALLAQIKMLGIGIAIVVGLLLLDDVIESHFGKKSAVLTWCDELEKRFPKLTSLVKLIRIAFAWWSAEVTVVAEGLKLICDSLKYISSTFPEALKAVGSVVMPAVGIASRMSNGLTNGSISAEGGAMKFAQSVQDIDNPNSTVNHVSMPVTLTVPPGTSHQDSVKIVSDGMHTFWNRIMRQTHKSIPKPIQ